MNSIVSIAAAAAIAAGAAGFVASPANADTHVSVSVGVPGVWREGYRYPRATYRHGSYIYFNGGYWYPRAYWTYAPRRGYRGPSVAHVNWCMSHRVNYNPASNTFLGRDGRRHVCFGPYA